MAESAGLSARGTLRRVEQVIGKVLRELPAAVEEVASMPADGAMLDIFARAIAGRAREVMAHAREDGPTG